MINLYEKSHTVFKERPEMKRITQKDRIAGFYQRFPLTDFFSFDITPWVSVVMFEGDETIMSEGVPPVYLYYLIDGRAKLYLTHDNGRISLINFLSAPCLLGEMELIGAQSAANGITAVTPCTCYAIRISEYKAMLMNDVRFMRSLCLFLGRKAIGNTSNYAQNQSYPLRVRLAGFILLTSNNGYYREKHTEISEYLGVTYRHLLYVLSVFVKKGFLEKTEKGYRIQSPEALWKIAHSDEGA